MNESGIGILDRRNPPGYCSRFRHSSCSGERVHRDSRL
jgi:hypothetical protein